MTVTNEDHGRQNVFAKEPPINVMEITVTHNEMLGVIAALGAYALTGQIIPGLW